MSGAVFLNQCMSLQGEEAAETARHVNRTRLPRVHRGLGRQGSLEFPTEEDRRGHEDEESDTEKASVAEDTTNVPRRRKSALAARKPENPSDMIGALRSLERAIHYQCSLLENQPHKALQREGSLKESRKNKAQSRSSNSLVTVPSTNDVQKLTYVPEVSYETYTEAPMSSSFIPVRGDKVRVFIRVVFLKIGEIDTLKESYAADVFVQAKWREPNLDGCMVTVGLVRTTLTGEDVDWDGLWNPKIYIENNLGELKESIWQCARFAKDGEAWVYERRRVKGCFLENLELDEFPFDTQDLTITVTSERSEAELDLEEDCSEISSINVQSFVDEQEWMLHSHVETWKRLTGRFYDNSKFKHPAISTSCRASRRPGFYLYNIFLVMLFICSLAFSTFTVEMHMPQSRLQLSFILLLTTITFKFVVSQTLPRISYLTYLDKYILTSMGILCGVCVWHSITPLLKGPEDQNQKADHIALGILGGFYLGFHIVFFLYIYFVALRKRWKYNEKDREHKEKIKKFSRTVDIEWAEGNSVQGANDIFTV